MDNNFMNFRLKLIFLALCILIFLAIKGHIRLGYAPELEKKNIAIAFDYYGAFEKEVESLVSSLEEAYMELEGIKDIHSVSEPGKGYILCMFSDKTKLDEAYVQVSDITSNVWSDFPAGVNRPSITRSSRDTYPVYISYFPLEKEADADLIKKAYEAVPGVGNVELGGLKKKELMVELTSGRSAGMALPGDVLGSRLRSSNLARKVAMPGGETLVLSSRLSSAADFSQVHMTPSLKLSDLADIKHQLAVSQSLGHINGQSVLLFFIMKSGEGNTVRLCRELEKVTSQFNGGKLYSLGKKIEKSFIGSSSILLLLFIFLLFGQWFKTRNIHLAAQAICRCIIALLVAISSVTAIGQQVDMTVMMALFLVVAFSFMGGRVQVQNNVPQHYKEPINKQDILILRSIGRKSINDFTSEDIEKSGKWAYKFWQQLGTKSPFFRSLFGDWRENDISNVKHIKEIKLLKAKDQNEAVSYIKVKVKDGTLFRGDKTNSDTGLKINIGRQVYGDTVTYANRAYSRERKHDEYEAFNNYLAKVSILASIGDIVERSILLDTKINDDQENPYRSFMHHFYCIANIGNSSYLVKLLVDEINSEGADTYRAYNVKDIKIAPVVGIKVYKPSRTTSADGSSTSTYTVADLHSLVKKYDKTFHPRHCEHHPKEIFAVPVLLIFLTMIILLYAPVYLMNLVLPFCAALTAGCCASALFLYVTKKIILPQFRIPLWGFSPILLFALGLSPFSPFSSFGTDVSFSLEYDSGTSFHFIQQSALDIEAVLLKWNAFDCLTLHIDQGKASFTVLGVKKRDILAKINELSVLYPEIFFYIPEKHTRHSIDVTVYGNDVSEIENNILQLAKYVNKYTNNVNIIYNFKSDVTNIVFEIPVKCTSAGLYPYEVYKTLYYTVSEPVVDKYFADDMETDVKIRGDVRYRETLSGLLSVPVLSPFGMAGEVGDYINVRRESAQGRIYHKNRMRILSFSVTGIRRARLREIVSKFPFTGSCHGEVG